MSAVAMDHGQHVGKFSDFLREYCRDDIGDLARGYPKDRQSLYVEAHDLFKFDGALLDQWIASPETSRDRAREALYEYDLPVDVDLTGADVRLTDHEGTLQRIGVTDLSQAHIENYVAVTGDLARITKKKPRIHEGAFRCELCETLNKVPQYRTSFQEPHQCRSCERKGPFRREDDQTEWRDQRKVKLEEPIEERAQSRGQHVACFLENDLCEYSPTDDGTLPDHSGARATVLGIVKPDESQLQGRNASPETDFWIEARAIVLEDGTEQDIDIDEHKDEFTELAARENAADLVAQSIAPSLHAPDGADLRKVKRGAGAWLFNAFPMDPEGFERKRGDMHFGLIGDPGTGKSTLMSYLDDVAPKSEFRSGTGLTEAGLTSAATQEEFAGVSEWTLEPGILPRANGGHCLIDEIDGAIDSDTKAMHDALEGDQMVKADKAGIKADLPTRTAVMVGGNPVHSRFDAYGESFAEQIDIDPALFDRLDLLFALQDTVDEERDRDTAEHVLDNWDELATAKVDQLDPEEAETIDPPVSKDVLRAWVAYARENVFPTPSQAAKDVLGEYYVEVRDLNDGHGQGDSGAVPATARTLWAGIRLATSFARLRLSDTVEVQDAKNAVDLSKEVVGLNFDPESGEFDADRHTGTPKSQRDRIKNLCDLVDEIEEGRTGGAPRDEVVEQATEIGIGEEKAERELDKLLEKGELYRPNSGEVSTT